MFCAVTLFPSTFAFCFWKPEAELAQCRAARDAMTIGRAKAEARLAESNDQLREARVAVAKITKSPVKFLCGW